MPIFVLSVVAVVALLTAFFWLRWRRRLIAERRRLPCPASGQDVDCVLLREPGSPHWIDVASCSGRSRPGTRCHNACIHVLNLGIELREGRVELESDSDGESSAR